MARTPDLLPFIRRTLRLLDLERQAEIDENARLLERLTPEELQRRGRCLLHLEMQDVQFGLGGRVHVDLVSTRGPELPSHRMQTGDVVMIRSAAEDEPDEPTGVIARVRRESITVALDDDLESELRGKLRLDKVANDVTYRRLRAALDRLESSREAPGVRLRSVCFGERDPRRPEAIGFTPLDDHLNPSQLDAIAFALGAPDLALIHGPPGTGKTTTVAELIYQASRRRESILACAASNVAVDNLAEKLLGRGLRIVRVGHPARLLPAIVESSLDAQVERSPSQRLLRNLRKDLDICQKRMLRANRNERYDLRNELRHLRRGIRELESGIVKGILSAADVILATHTGAGSTQLQNREFDLVVIDEAAQALEAACWVPLLMGRRAVLAGDHKQLPPTIRSQEAARGGLDVTLFERLEEEFPFLSKLLQVQYRMHEQIMGFSSAELYGGSLIADASVKHHLLRDLEGVEDTDDTREPVVFIDTAGYDATESTDEDEVSRWNEGEAKLVVQHVRNLLAAGVPPHGLGVITPYNGQVDLLRRKLADAPTGLEIDSVDGFQGREKEAIVISLVRSNDAGIVGFLADQRRLNVAITRARRHLTVIGDSSTLANDAFLGRLVEHLQAHGVHRSAWEVVVDE